MITKSRTFTFPHFWAVAVLWLFSAAATGDCDFDTDDADSPDFMAKILACEKNAKTPSNKDQKPSAAQPPATKLYGDGTVDPVSGMAERPIVAAGSLNHSANKSFVARQSYSLRPDAKFEQSVTIAIQRLHVEMAHYCAKGWRIEGEWSEPDANTEGDYFLHYQFRCAS